MEFLDALQFPFFQRALIGGAFLGTLLAYVGSFAVLRRMSFFGDGVAHASLAGIALGILAAWNPLLVALALGVLFAVGIFYLEKKTTLSTDAIIGILFTAFMALGVILMSLRSGYQPELVSFLFGNILTIKTIDLYLIAGIAVLIISLLTYFYRQISFITFDEEGAEVAGIYTDRFNLLFYIALSVSVILGAKILGIILVSALLIIPPSTSKLVAKSFKQLISRSIVVGEITILGGLFASYFLNFPAGATVVLFGAFVFLAVFLLRRRS